MKTLDKVRSARELGILYSEGERMLLCYAITSRHSAVTRSKANEASSSTSRTIRRWVLVAAARFANYPKQLKASSKKIRRRYLGRSENNSDTRPPASSPVPFLSLSSAEWNSSSSPADVAPLRFSLPFVVLAFLSFPVPRLPALAAINLRGRRFEVRLDSS